MCADKFCIVLVAIYSLLQSGATVILGTLGIMMAECILAPSVPDNFDETGGTILLNFFRQFFYTQKKCNALNYETLPEYNSSIIVNPAQTEGWLIGYLIDNALFFIGSLCLLGGITIRKKWLITIYLSTLSSVILYDIVLVVVYGLDISVATDPQKNSDFFNPPIVPPGADLPIFSDAIILMNTIAMMVYFSRFVIFFILNIVCYFVVQASVNKLAKPRAKVSPSQQPPNGHFGKNYGYPQQQHLNQHYRQPYPVPVHNRTNSAHDPYSSMGAELRSTTMVPYQPTRSYDNFALNSEDSIRNGFSEPHTLVIPELPREPRNMELEINRKRQQFQTSHAGEHQYPAVDYDIPRANEKLRKYSDVGRSATSPSRDSINSRSEGLQETFDNQRPKPRRTSSSSVSSEVVASELKGQLPWSYVRPEQLPSAGSNKLRQFYMNKQKSGVSNRLAAPQESDEESYDPRNARY